MGCSQASTILDCGVSSPTRLAINLIHADARVDEGSFRDMRARQKASRLPGMDALACQRLDVETIDHIDLLLQRLKRLERLTKLHGGARTLGAPMILIDAVSQENDAEAFREGGGRRRIGESVKRLKPRHLSLMDRFGIKLEQFGDARTRLDRL